MPGEPHRQDVWPQRTDHLSSLTKLAEKTVTEADEIAAGMKQEALDQAKAEAAAIIAQAEEQAQQIESETSRVQLDLRNSVQGLYEHLLTELDSLKQKVATLQTESEQKLSPLAEVASKAALNRASQRESLAP